MNSKSLRYIFGLAFFLFLCSCEREELLFTSEILEFPSATQIEIENTQPDFTAKVIRIVDGDTLEVMYGELPVMIRLAHIDCPEIRSSQPFGKKAKQTLSDLCFGENVEIEFSGDKDRNGRYICVIYNQQGLNLNKEMMKRGMAWHFKKYSEDNAYAELEKEARESKIGLWQDPNPVAPWNWRKK